MAKNIELKMKIEEFSYITDILLNKKINKVQTINQRDIYYKHPDGLLKLRIYDGNGEFIFYQRNENTKDRVSNYRILNVEPEQAEKFFEHIFEIEAQIVKVRKLYVYKNTRIHLDKVEKLGTFLELETVVNNENIQKGKEEFNEVVHLLKLDLTKQIKSSYRTLLLNR